MVLRHARYPQNQAIEDKQRTGRHLAVEYLKTRAEKLGIQPDETIFRINRGGFKGPELDESQSRTRILTIGDSCTFGSLFDGFTYPRSLERELQTLGLSAEVINGGVEGYFIQNVRFRIEQFKTLKPDIVTSYVGGDSTNQGDSGALSLHKVSRPMGVTADPAESFLLH